MAKLLVMEVYEVEGTDAENALATAEAGAKPGAAVHVADSLGGMLNPYHWAVAQEKFGHVKPEQAPAEAAPESNG